MGQRRPGTLAVGRYAAVVTRGGGAYVHHRGGGADCVQRLALRMASFIDLRTASLRLDFVFSALLLCRRFAVGRLMASHFDKSAFIRFLPYVLYPGASSLTELRPAANLLPELITDAAFIFEANLPPRGAHRASGAT